MKKKLTRRDFLKVASIGTASAVALSCGLIETPHLQLTVEPVDDVLYFAGEATSREYPATVHGAYLSGVAAAAEIA